MQEIKYKAQQPYKSSTYFHFTFHNVTDDIVCPSINTTVLVDCSHKLNNEYNHSASECLSNDVTLQEFELSAHCHDDVQSAIN